MKLRLFAHPRGGGGAGGGGDGGGGGGGGVDGGRVGGGGTGGGGAGAEAETLVEQMGVGREVEAVVVVETVAIAGVVEERATG